MTILICGGRNWFFQDPIKREIVKYSPGILIHGGCQGADLIAASIANDLGWQVKEYKADWDRYGKAAGPKRNVRMLQEGNPDIVMGFHEDIMSSRGTRHMLKIAAEANKTVLLFYR